MSYKLKNVDPEDIDFALLDVQKSFDIKFSENELDHIVTFGELCDYIVSKIDLEHYNDCTSQQAFYMLRNAIANSLQKDPKTILPGTRLDDIFVRPIRRFKIREVERQLDLKLNILRPPHWVSLILAIIVLSSLVGLFFHWKISVAGLALGILAGWLANNMGNELCLDTAGQVAEKMTRENYLKSRRDPRTFNKKEIENVLIELFSDRLGLDKSEFSRDEKLV